MTPSADAVAGDEQYITLLPSLIMAAWHHKKLAPELQALSAEQIAEQARQFASREYLHALYKGDRMTPEERAKVVANLSRLTGLSKAFIVNNNLRITLDRFIGELLRDQRRALSDSDARVTGFVPPSERRPRRTRRVRRRSRRAIAIDYNQNNLAAGFLPAYETYLRRELAFTNANGIFYLSSGGIGTFTSTGNDDASLSAAFARNPSLRLFVGVNYFDLNAPFYATEFTLAHLNVSPEVRAHNITVRHFEAGQMAYVDTKSLAKLRADLAKFINDGDIGGAPLERTKPRSTCHEHQQTIRSEVLRSRRPHRGHGRRRLRPGPRRPARPTTSTGSTTAWRRCSRSTTPPSRSPPSIRSRSRTRRSNTPPTSDSCPSATPRAA